MCKPASFIVTRERTYFGKYTDSHTKIFKEHGLKDDGQAITVEVTPPNDNFREPFDNWLFRVDSNHRLPKWWNAQWAEAECKALLPEWAKTHLFLDQKGLKIDLKNVEDPSMIFVNCEAEVSNQTGGLVRFYDNSTGTVSGQTGGDVRFWENSTGTVSGQTGGDVRFWDNSKRIDA